MVTFLADRMLGRLAKMLRLLGYDTLYERDFTPARIAEIAAHQDRVLLTRGNAEKRFPGIARVIALKSESPPEQLRELVVLFRLDVRVGLWTRCTLCNGAIERADKAVVESLVPPKVAQVYDEFFRCAACGHVYWMGSHVERILKNLSSLLTES